MNPRVLCVDDEPNVLSGLRRQLHGRFELTLAESGAAGLEKIRASNEIYPVIMSDFRMPHMDGTKFLAAARQLSPDSVRVMLTGQADLQAAIDAVNEGNIFRFLSKPCPSDLLIKNLESCCGQYKLVIAERELLEKTLRGTIKILSDVLAMVSPAAFSRASRIRTIACGIARELPSVNLWEVEVAAMLSQIGCVTVPSSIVDRVIAGKQVPDEAEKLFRGHPISGRDLLANIPRLEAVAEAIRTQMLGPDLSRSPLPRPLGLPPLARVLQVSVDLERLLGSGMPANAALSLLLDHQPPDDHGVLQALGEYLGASHASEGAVKTLSVSQVQAGMIIAEDILDKTGKRLVASGFEVTEVLRIRLVTFAQYGTIATSVKVFDSPPK